MLQQEMEEDLEMWEEVEVLQTLPDIHLVLVHQMDLPILHYQQRQSN